jgi:hypothetical protein
VSADRARVSLFRYSPALILIAIAVADATRLADPDLWGHVRFGQAVLDAGHIVRRDPYSYSAPGHLWLNHEWLSELIMAALYYRLGVFGLKLMKLACSASIVIFVAASESETGAPTLLQFAILLISAVTIAPQIQFRPQVFSFALLSALIYMLTREAYGRRRAPLWLAVPMLAIWANLHGGFILGIATLAVYSATAAVQDVVDRRGTARARRLGAITGASALVTIATPYGIGTWHAVLQALFNPYTRIVVADWQPLLRMPAGSWRSESADALYIVLAIAPMALLLFSYALTPSKEDLPLVAVAAVMSAGAFVSVRNLPAAIIASAAPLARHLPQALERRWPAIRNDPRAARHAPALNQAIIVACALATFWFTGLFSNRLAAAGPYPAAALAFMKDRGLGGNVLAQFGWGEYLIWHLEPGSKVFIDGRYDTVYPPEVVQQFLVFNYNQPGGDNALTAYPTDYVLIPPDIGARSLMDSRKDWRLIYSDDTARLYARANSPAARLDGVPVAGTAREITFP